MPGLPAPVENMILRYVKQKADWWTQVGCWIIAMIFNDELAASPAASLLYRSWASMHALLLIADMMLAGLQDWLETTALALANTL